MASTKKQKPQSISLNDFVGKAEEDWASLPSQPTAVVESMPEAYRSTADSQARAPDFTKIQPGGPYVAYVGNFPFNTTEAHLAEFFDGLPLVSVKIALDYATKESRGYAYVEFQTEKALRDAVTANGTDFSGRRLRIDVADVKERTSKFGSSGSYQQASSSGMPRSELAMKREQFAMGDTPGDWRTAAASSNSNSNSSNVKREGGVAPQGGRAFGGSRFSKDDFVFKRRED